MTAGRSRDNLQQLETFNGTDGEGVGRLDVRSNHNADIYGNFITNNKNEHTLRIGFANINGLPSFNYHQKNEEHDENHYLL